MYTLYYSPGACSLAVHVVLRALGLKFELENVAIDAGKNRSPEYLKINSRGSVPTLVENGVALRESASIVMHLLDQHPNTLLPKSGLARVRVVEWLLFANSTLHQAYGAFFLMRKALKDENAKAPVNAVIARRIQGLWDDTEKHLQANGPYLTGAAPCVGDILTTVIANWTQRIEPEVTVGPKVGALLAGVNALPYFAESLAAEGLTYKMPKIK